MADETYRGFHAGKYGPQGSIDIPFDTKISAVTGTGTAAPKKEEKKDKDKENDSDDQRKKDDEFMQSDEGGESTSWFSGGG